MSIKRTQPTYRYFNKSIQIITDKLKHVSFPGFEKVPIYNVFLFFFNGLKKGSLNTRAASISFNFMLALGPALIFFLAIIPYLPINNFQNSLEEFLYEIMPENSIIAIEPILDEIFLRRGGLPIIGLLTSLFFAQKGVNGIIDSFNATFHSLDTRTWYRQRLVSIALVFIFYSLGIIISLLFFMSKGIVNSIAQFGNTKAEAFLLFSGKWITLVAVTFICISVFYYMAPSRKTKWKFFSAGSTLSTILSIAASLGFTYFMDNIAQLSKFFGTIGALIALMLWMNFIALTLLIGFELNASINNAHLNTLKE